MFAIASCYLKLLLFFLPRPAEGVSEQLGEAQPLMQISPL